MTLREVISLPEDSPERRQFIKTVFDIENADKVELYRSVLSVWRKYRKTGQAGQLAKFMRMADGLSGPATGEAGLEEFIVSVYLALDQPVNLDNDLDTFYALHKAAVRKSKYLEEMSVHK